MGLLDSANSPLNVIVHGAAVQNPAANAVMADSGPFGGPQIAGDSTRIKIQFGGSGTPVSDYIIAHRDATNTIDLEACWVSGTLTPGPHEVYMELPKVGERFVVRIGSQMSLSSGYYYQVSMFINYQ